MLRSSVRKRVTMTVIRRRQCGMSLQRTGQRKDPERAEWEENISNSLLLREDCKEEIPSGDSQVSVLGGKGSKLSIFLISNSYSSKFIDYFPISQRGDYVPM